MTSEDFRKVVDAHRWFHSIDLGDGIVTAGMKSQETLSAESLVAFSMLQVRGCSVIDIGAWNGFFTTEAVRKGAENVLAVDSYTWTHPDLLGKEAFDLVISRLDMQARVETKTIEVSNISEESVGKWDIVLFLGVFYHLIDPIIALQQLASITKEVLVLETYLDLNNVKQPAMVFYPGKELNNDPTNWWGPNRACIEALLKMVGFQKIVYTQYPEKPQRGFFHAYKTEADFQKHAAHYKVQPITILQRLRKNLQQLKRIW